ncbi:MAG: FAD-linked oxidase C-terminal domain-containing protein [Shinella sp.]|nr:FAD-linked oxidase C-terminal domain-containing protein [Shinella sp.]
MSRIPVFAADTHRVRAAIGDLRAVLGERLSTGESVRALHARDNSHHAARLPDAVAFPRSSEEVGEILRIAARHHVAVVPFGAGSGLEGGAIPLQGGISIDTSGLDRILEIRAGDMIARVGAGVRRLALNAALKDTGLFFPVDPGTDASLGGMAATGASGTNAVRFGTMRENVLGLTVVTADGAVVRTGSLARKSSSGYDLTHLFVGSEGTLGVITEVRLRLHPLPDTVSARARFETLAGAVDAVIDIRRAGISIGKVELLDAATIAVMNRHSPESGLPSAPTLFFEFHGRAEEIRPVADLIAEIVASHEGALIWAEGHAGQQALWNLRRDVLGWAKSERAGARAWPTDVCVPVSALADVVLATDEDIAASPVPAYIVGHVGDGNFHCVFMMRDGEEDIVHAFADRIALRAIEAGGTVSGEHGIGLGKRDYLEREHGAEAVALMRALKATLDPDNILNPGKVLPDAGAPSDSIHAIQLGHIA